MTIERYEMSRFFNITGIERQNILLSMVGVLVSFVFIIPSFYLLFTDPYVGAFCCIFSFFPFIVLTPILYIDLPLKMFFSFHILSLKGRSLFFNRLLFIKRIELNDVRKIVYDANKMSLTILTDKEEIRYRAVSPGIVRFLRENGIEHELIKRKRSDLEKWLIKLNTGKKK